MEEIAGSLGIKLSELFTQIIGFLIAFWILKRFAWKPLMGMLEQRRSKIKTDLESAEMTTHEADRILSEYREQLKQIDAEARIKIQEAIANGNRVATEIREQARAEAKEIISKSREELSRDIAKAKAELRNDMVRMAIVATEKIIAEKLDDQKHRDMIANFLSEVEDIK